MQLDFLQQDVLPEAGSVTPKKPLPSPKKTACSSTEMTAPGEEASVEENEKSPRAFKTISEAASILEVPQHVLRFWESRFSQIKPLKLRGGRRYYRPEDMEILFSIKHKLYKEGYTIKGARKAFNSRPVTEDAAAAPMSADHRQQALIQLREELIAMQHSLEAYL